MRITPTSRPARPYSSGGGELGYLEYKNTGAGARVLGDVNNILSGQNALLDRVKHRSPEREGALVIVPQVERAAGRTFDRARRRVVVVLEHPRGGQGGHGAI